MGGVNMMDPALIWFVVGLVFLMAELIAPGLVIVFFGVGAWIVAAVCLVKPISLNLQLIIFIVTSAVVLACLRNRFKTLFSGHTTAVQNPNKDIEDFVGKRAVVKETIVPHKSGKVELNGTLWNADASEEIAIGESVHIVSIDNLLLKVKKS
ncbi:MAG: NfeD family protein [Candidatus Omnitrophica bacterium]|nr:NfeD family protein [Candidatus Omnitrophota bacterium]